MKPPHSPATRRPAKARWCAVLVFTVFTIAIFAAWPGSRDVAAVSAAAAVGARRTAFLSLHAGRAAPAPPPPPAQSAPLRDERFEAFTSHPSASAAIFAAFRKAALAEAGETKLRLSTDLDDSHADGTPRARPALLLPRFAVRACLQPRLSHAKAQVQDGFERDRETLAVGGWAGGLLCARGCGGGGGRNMTQPAAAATRLPPLFTACPGDDDVCVLEALLCESTPVVGVAQAARMERLFSEGGGGGASPPTTSSAATIASALLVVAGDGRILRAPGQEGGVAALDQAPAASSGTPRPASLPPHSPGAAAAALDALLDAHVPLTVHPREASIVRAIYGPPANRSLAVWVSATDDYTETDGGFLSNMGDLASLPAVAAALMARTGESAPGGWNASALPPVSLKKERLARGGPGAAPPPAPSAFQPLAEAGGAAAGAPAPTPSKAKQQGARAGEERAVPPPFPLSVAGVRLTSRGGGTPAPCLVAVGSVLGYATQRGGEPKAFWGAGAIDGRAGVVVHPPWAGGRGAPAAHAPAPGPLEGGGPTAVSAPTVADADYVFAGVRGPRTRALLLARHGVHAPPVGDPALLLPALIPAGVGSAHALAGKPFDLLIILHTADVDAFRAHPFYRTAMASDSVFVTSNTASLRAGLARLWLAKRVISSALHGVVLSHAYGVNVLPVRISDALVGGEWKFADHYHAVGHHGFSRRVSFDDLVGGASVESIMAAVDSYWQPAQPPSTRRLVASFPLPADLEGRGGVV